MIEAEAALVKLRAISKTSAFNEWLGLQVTAATEGSAELFAVDFYPRFFAPCYFLPITALFTQRPPMNMIALDKWYDYVKSHDRAMLWDALHPDAVFESPVVHTPQRGRDVMFKYLSSAVKVLGGPSFAFVGEWHSDTGAVVEFEGEIDGIRINGVDIITVGDDGRITRFKVMVRPLQAVNLLHRLMEEQLAKQ
jgi:hypothetical protein